MRGVYLLGLCMTQWIPASIAVAVKKTDVYREEEKGVIQAITPRPFRSTDIPERLSSFCFLPKTSVDSCNRLSKNIYTFLYLLKCFPVWNSRFSGDKRYQKSFAKLFFYVLEEFFDDILSFNKWCLCPGWRQLFCVCNCFICVAK